MKTSRNSQIAVEMARILLEELEADIKAGKIKDPRLIAIMQSPNKIKH